jgi:hypothetical protein
MLAYSHVAPEGPSTYAARPSIPMAATLLSEPKPVSSSTLQDVVDLKTQGAKLLVRAFGKILPGI